jgi:methionyl-tRNA formyltransferase
MSIDKPSVILMGSKPGATAALSILLKRGWNVKYVVVSKSIHHDWITSAKVEELACEKNIKVVSQNELPRNQDVDFVISYMFRHRVKSDVIDMGRRGALNFHAGPLPGFGGWAFYNIAILENVSEYGCTCHYLDNDFDTGPLLKVRRFPVDMLKETACSLESKTQREMIKLFVDFCDIAENQSTLPFEEQDQSKYRYMTQSEFQALKEIPHDADAETIERYARAFWFPPYECAYVKIGNTRVEVVPKLAKNELARLIHANDLDELMKAIQE